MPWIGLVRAAASGDGEPRRVTPEQVSDGATVTCPDCGEDMHPRGPTIDGKARHFVHATRSDAANCAGGGSGESDTHRRMKSQVISAVSQWFGGSIARIEPEVSIDVTASASPADTRYADVHAVFSPPHPVIGEYLAVEVQYRNHAKPLEPVTHDYIVTGRSVYWATSDVFDADRFHIDELVHAFHAADTPALDQSWEASSPRAGTQLPVAVVAEPTSPLQYDPVANNHSRADGETEDAEDRAESTDEPESERFEVRSNDGGTVTLPGIVDPGYLHVHENQAKEEVPDVLLMFPDEDFGLRYASRDTHPSAQLEAAVPRTTPDGHPIPQIPDCDHRFNPVSGIGPPRRDQNRRHGGVPCEKCGEVLYRTTRDESSDTSSAGRRSSSGDTYYFMARPYSSVPSTRLCFKGDSPISSGETQLPYCGDRIWRVDFDADEYQCTTCGQRFPRRNAALRDQYGHE